MKGRVWILLVLAGLALLAGSVPVFRDNFSEGKSASFADVLEKQYPGWSGFTKCVPTPPQGLLDCWGEIHNGSQYRLVERREGITQAGDIWTRAMQPVPAQTLRTFGASGTAVANTLFFDWGPVAGGLVDKPLPTVVSAANATTPASAPAEIFSFTCAKAGTKVRCANAVGDAFVYTPAAKT